MSMTLPLSDYKTFVFDCDGVLLNSNLVKTQAFYQAALPFGKAAAQDLLEYHVANGGVSRYKKFTYFLEHIVPSHISVAVDVDLESLLSTYAQLVKKGLLNCEVTIGLRELRHQTRKSKWLVVSGGDQRELHSVFARRNLTYFFDGGIFGSPDTKDHILARELENGNIQFPALFLGDSKYDYQAAHQAGLDFVFINGWSEVKNHADWCRSKGLFSIDKIAALLLEDLSI